jgi:hypothetical protein
MVRVQSHGPDRRVWGTDGGTFTPHRASAPRDAGFGQNWISRHQAPRAKWIFRSNKPYSSAEGIFNPPSPSREPGRTSVALRQIGTDREATLGRSGDPRSRTGSTSPSPDHTYHVGPHAMIITPHNEDLAKFNRDGSTGQIYVSHLPGHAELYLIMPFKEWPQQ